MGIVTYTRWDLNKGGTRGLLNVISPILLLLFGGFFHNVFIDKAAFNSCQNSSVAVIPIPYECDLQNLTAAFNTIPGGEYNGWGFITAPSYISDIAVPGILPW